MRTILVIYINNNIITLLVLQGARDIFEVITESKKSDTAQGMPFLQINTNNIVPFGVCIFKFKFISVFKSRIYKLIIYLTKIL